MNLNPLQPIVDRLEGQLQQAAELFIELAGTLAEAEPEALTSGMLRAVRRVTGASFSGFQAVGDASVTWLVDEAIEFAEAPDPSRAPLLAAAVAEGTSLLIDDVARWARSDEALQPYGSLQGGRAIRSWMVSPVGRPSGTRYGAILVGDPLPRLFTPRQEGLVRGVADMLASALEKEELLRERSRVAHALQENLLPPLLPVVPGLELAARYRATGAGNLVGGDFYDVFEVGDGVWAAVLGDVSGFGPEAAAITGMARYTVRAVARTHPQPSTVLAALNHAIGNQRASDRFCTAVYCRLRPVPGGGAKVTFSLGGHPPPLVLRDDGSVEAVRAEPGLPLGMFDDAVLADDQVHLEPGDTIVMYTDGVIEARAASGEQFGQDRLEELLSTCAGRTADGIARRVELAVIDFQDGDTNDDVAVVAIRATGRPASPG